MADKREVVIFGEDVGHERFVTALVKRVAVEEGVGLSVRTGSGRGGHGRALTELRDYQRALVGVPDLLVAAIDSNCNPSWTNARDAAENTIDQAKFPRSVVACPEPHIERWFMADPPSLFDRFDVRVAPKKRKCARDVYKDLLRSVFEAAGQPVVLGGIEYAEEVVDAMDLYAAGRNEPSLKHFLDGLRAALRGMR